MPRYTRLDCLKELANEYRRAGQPNRWLGFDGPGALSYVRAIYRRSHEARHGLIAYAPRPSLAVGFGIVSLELDSIQ